MARWGGEGIRRSVGWHPHLTRHTRSLRSCMEISPRSVKRLEIPNPEPRYATPAGPRRAKPRHATPRHRSRPVAGHDPSQVTTCQPRITLSPRSTSRTRGPDLGRELVCRSLTEWLAAEEKEKRRPLEIRAKPSRSHGAATYPCHGQTGAGERSSARRVSCMALGRASLQTG